MIILLLLSLPLDAEYLMDEGIKAKCQCVLGDFKTAFYWEAERHSRYMAKHGRQNHDFFIKRVKRLQLLFPECREFAEICSESWPGQTIKETAWDAFNISWPASPGHYKIAKARSKYWAGAIVKGKNGICYVTIIVAY